MSRVDMPDEEIGIRAYHIQQEKAVERAIEKIRQRLSDSWKELSLHEIEVLRWVLGETWATHRRTDWDEISFSSIKLAVVLKVIRIGDQIVNNEKPGHQGFNEINKVLSTF
jgi:hypothetical protein